MNPSRRAHLKQLVGTTLAVNAAFFTRLESRLNACERDIDQEEKGFEAEFPSMGSKINLRWYSSATSQDEVIKAATGIADLWIDVLSDYEPTSQAMVACAKADSGDWVQVSNELWSVLQHCEQWNRWSEGAFDAALGAITRIRWQRKPAPPELWAKARLKSGWKLLELDHPHQAMRFLTPGVRLDFGAIGKGIVVDRIAEKLEEMGIEKYVVNASGNMRMGNAPNGTAGWPIAIDIPATLPNETSIEFLRSRFSNGGIATSGDRWQRFPDANAKGSDERTSHIVEPTTAKGLSGHQSVTIMAGNATDADAAATATCVRARRDLAGWLQTLSERKPNLHAIVMLKDSDTDPMRFVST